MPKLPIGLVAHSNEPLQRVASYAWLAQQITGRPASDTAIASSLSRVNITPDAAHIAAVRKMLADRAR